MRFLSTDLEERAAAVQVSTMPPCLSGRVSYAQLLAVRAQRPAPAARAALHATDTASDTAVELVGLGG